MHRLYYQSEHPHLIIYSSVCGEEARICQREHPGYFPTAGFVSNDPPAVQSRVTPSELVFGHKVQDTSWDVYHSTND
jgi:hypothetical protein